MNDANAPDARTSVSTTEAAALLGVSKPTVQRWVDRGHLKAWKTVGHHRRIELASVLAFIAEKSTGEVTPMPRSAAPRALTVLIVDDSPEDRALLRALAVRVLFGATVDEADDGFAALVAIGRQVPDVLITDIMMPHMDGLEMLRHVCALETGRPRVIVAVSNLAPARITELGGVPKDVLLLRKPVSQAALLGAMGRSGLVAGLPDAPT
ncbi:helix-turn-helix domain-containing protein [Rhizobacter fulvus]